MRRLLILLLLAALVPTASAKPTLTLNVDVGFAGHYRAQRWTPVVITVNDPAIMGAFPAFLDIVIPHDTSFRMVVHQAITGNSVPYVLYLPLPSNLDGTVVTLTNPAGKTIGQVEFDPMQPNSHGPILTDADKTVLMGVSGAGRALSALEGAFYYRDDSAGTPPSVFQMAVAQISPSHLPDIPQAYESLDVLVLNAPNLLSTSIAYEQQRTIVAWVRAGGQLLLWPGTGPIPADSPIAQILPAKIGDPRPLPISIEQTKALSVASRNAQLPCWDLTPNANANKMPIKGLDPSACAVDARVGMGAVMLLSVDPASLVFNNQPAAVKFFRPMLARLHLQRQSDDYTNTPSSYGGNSRSVDELWRAAAMEQIVDRLGNVPGVGAFNFSYIAIVLIGLMFIVGPIDWFILKKLGKQPWTWVTISGWVALITLGGFYIGHIFRSGDLHYRTLRVIDQADNATVAVHDVVGIYSPQTQRYSISSPADSWWQPAAFDPPDPYARRSSRAALTDIDFQQDKRGQYIPGDANHLAMNISVWSLRFLEADIAEPAKIPQALAATAKRSAPNDATLLTGTITNKGSTPLLNVVIRHHGHYAMITVPTQSAPLIPGNDPGTPSDPVIATETVTPSKPASSISPPNPEPAAPLPASIAPGQTLTFTVKLTDMDYPLRVGGSSSNNVSPWDVASRYNNSQRKELQFIRAGTDLSVARSDRIDRIMDGDDSAACVYGECEIPQGTVELFSGGLPAKTQHWQVVRALITLDK